MVTTTRVDLSADPHFLLDWEAATTTTTQVIHKGRNVEAMGSLGGIYINLLVSLQKVSTTFCMVGLGGVLN